MAHSFFVLVPDYLIVPFRYNPGDTFRKVIDKLESLEAPTVLTYYNGIECFALEPEREILSCFPERHSQVLIFASDEELILPTVKEDPNRILMMVTDERRPMTKIILEYVDPRDTLEDVVINSKKLMQRDTLTFRLGSAILEPPREKQHRLAMEVVLPKRIDQILCRLNVSDTVKLPLNNIIEILYLAILEDDVKSINVVLNGVEDRFGVGSIELAIYNDIIPRAVKDNSLNVLNLVIDYYTLTSMSPQFDIEKILFEAIKFDKPEIVQQMLIRYTPYLYTLDSNKDLLINATITAEHLGNTEIAQILREYRRNKFDQNHPMSSDTNDIKNITNFISDQDALSNGIELGDYNLVDRGLEFFLGSKSGLDPVFIVDLLARAIIHSLEKDDLTMANYIMGNIGRKYQKMVKLNLDAGLIEGVKRGDTSLVQNILDLDYEFPFIKIPTLNYSMMLAVQNGDTDTVSLLLDKGATNYEEALRAGREYPEIVELILNHHPELR